MDRISVDRPPRVFVTDASGADWSELTDGEQLSVRVTAPDLLQARRERARIRAESGDVAVILDISVAVAGDFRSARSALGAAAETETVNYVGTVDGLAGLISDIQMADVADGVTLMPALPRQDLRALGRDVLRRLATRGQARAS